VSLGLVRHKLLDGGRYGRFEEERERSRLDVDTEDALQTYQLVEMFPVLREVEQHERVDEVKRQARWGQLELV